MRNFKIRNIFLYILIIYRIFCITKNPFKIISHYILRTSPKFIKLRNGITIFTSSNPHDIITFVVIFAKKDYGEIEKNSVVVDIGANIGIFTLYALSNGASQVVAFEPCKESFDTMKMNIEKNKFNDKVNLNKIAIGNKDDSSILISKKSSPYNSILKEEGVFNNENTENVKTSTLDKALIKVKQIDLLKMDCEGAEYLIFPTLTKNFLDKTKEIRMEFHGNLDKLISSLNYQPFKILNKNESDVWLVK